MDVIDSRLDAVLGYCLNSGPVAESEIAKAETELGLVFPPSYRRFLGRFGASLGNGFEIYGLPPESAPGQPPQWSHVVRITLRLRPDCLPKNSVAISDDGMDHVYFLDCSNLRSEGSIIEWGPKHLEGKVISASFLDFVEMRQNP